MKNFRVSQFSNFFLVGIDHKTANVEVREKFSLSEEQASHLIYDYKQMGGDGMMILSTCNRTEIYGFGNCPRDIISLFCKHTHSDRDLFYQHQHIKQNREAIEHLFRVGSGLESKILGDFEIIGQIKKSFYFAKEQNAHNAFLERMVNSCIQSSKKVKNETELSTGAASVAFAAVLKVKRMMEGGLTPKVVLVGTGKIGRTACENLVNQTGLKDITLINRTADKAQRLAERFGVKHQGFDQLDDAVSAADVVIVATGASLPTLNAANFRSSKKRLLLDLSMPRNVSAELYQHPDFEVIDVDHLSEVAEESMARRQAEIPRAEAIINEIIDEFYLWLESRRVAPTLQAVREKMDDWKERELQNLQKKFPKLSTEEADAFASQMLNRITGQFARQLKNGADINNDLRTIHHIFELEPKN